MKYLKMFEGHGKEMYHATSIHNPNIEIDNLGSKLDVTISDLRKVGSIFTESSYNDVFSVRKISSSKSIMVEWIPDGMIYLYIYKYDDDWWVMSFFGLRYICDQIDGLSACISEKFFNKFE